MQCQRLKCFYRPWSVAVCDQGQLPGKQEVFQKLQLPMKLFEKEQEEISPISLLSCIYSEALAFAPFPGYIAVIEVLGSYPPHCSTLWTWFADFPAWHPPFPHKETYPCCCLRVQCTCSIFCVYQHRKNHLTTMVARIHKVVRKQGGDWILERRVNWQQQRNNLNLPNKREDGQKKEQWSKAG